MKHLLGHRVYHPSVPMVIGSLGLEGTDDRDLEIMFFLFFNREIIPPLWPQDSGQGNGLIFFRLECVNFPRYMA